MIDHSVETATPHDELIDAAAAALAMLDSRRAHHPPEMLDAREGRAAKALRTALRKIDAAQGTERRSRA